MPSILESMGGLARSIFVPAEVIDSQRENDLMLAKKADELNGSPSILANVATDKTAATTLQNMNRDVFLSGNRDRETGEAIRQSLFDYVENIPDTLKQAVKGTGDALGEGIGGAIPIWLRVLLGLTLIGAILYFVSRLIK